MVTEILEEERAVSFLWRIKNLSFWNIRLKGRLIESPLFKTRNLYGCSWYLKLHPKGQIKGDQHIHVHLVLFSGVLDYAINCEVSFIGGDGLPLISRTIQNQVIRKGDSLKLEPCLLQEEVYLTKKSLFLPHETLTVVCCIWRSQIMSPTVDEYIYARSEILVKVESFQWSIKNFSGLQLNEKQTRLFELDFLSKSFVKLNFSFTGDSIDKSIMKFEIEAMTKERLSVVCKLSILDRTNKVILSEEADHIFKQSKRIKILKFHKFFYRETILDKKSDYLDNDELPVQVKIVITTGDYSEIKGPILTSNVK